MVDDQDKALKFYTGVLGFVKKTDFPAGGARWITVVSVDEPNGTEASLEPIAGFPAARKFQKALFEAGTPLVSFASGDIEKQVERLKGLGVKFSVEPTSVGPTRIAILDDTCGNHIQIYQTTGISNSTGLTSTLKIKRNSVLVDDQEKALKFYTETLGLVKKKEMPTGAARWLTVVSPDEPDGTELLLEPLSFAPARTWQATLHKGGIPLTQLAVADVQSSYDRLTRLGVVFRGKPTKMGPTTMAIFDDTCGNLIQLIQE
jgi:catechol 2,3-dioxygenase-like lactoylglutathione lyase family enzyme